MGVERGRRRFLLSPGIPRRRILIRSLAQQRAARGAPSDALPLAPRGRRDAPQCVRAPRRARRNPRSRRPQGSTGAPPGLKNLTGAEAQLDLFCAAAAQQPLQPLSDSRLPTLHPCSGAGPASPPQASQLFSRSISKRKMIIGLDVLRLAGFPLPLGIIIIIPGKLSECSWGVVRMFVGRLLSN